MVGGSGHFFDKGEKACIDLLGKPLISYVIDALEGSKGIDNIFVAASSASSDTIDLVNTQYGGLVKTVITSGRDYVGDMVHAVKDAGISGPVLLIMYDLVLVTPDLIDLIIEEYGKCGKPAMSVYVPISVYRTVGTRPETVFNRDGKLIVPTGINIMLGKDIHVEQEDYNLVLERSDLVMSVRTVDDLDRCGELLGLRSDV